MLILSIFSFFSGGIQSEQWKHQSNIGTFVIYIFLVSLNVKTNANPKIIILMSENIGQFSLEYFDALYYHQISKYSRENLVSFVQHF